MQTFRHLMHLHDGAVAFEQLADGGYNQSNPVLLNDILIARHLSGDLTFAFPMLKNNLATVIAFDLDSHAIERIKILRSAMMSLSTDLVSAAFVTGGSTRDKGKLLITLVEPIERDLARHVQEQLLLISERSPFFRGRSDIDLFPSRGKGGILRVGSRHITRNPTGMEHIESLNHFTLSKVNPLAHGALVAIFGNAELVQVPSFPAPTSVLQCTNSIPKIVTRYSHKWTKSFKTNNRDIYAIAHAFVLSGGNVVLYQTFLQDICRVSPSLHQLSPTGKDRRCPIERELSTLTAWRKAMSKTFEAHDSHSCPAAKPRDLEYYRRLCIAMMSHSGRIAAIDARRFAKLLGRSKSGGDKIKNRLADYGLLIIIDQGRKRELGIDGMCAIYALVGKGDSLDSVRTAAEALQIYLERIQKRRQAALVRLLPNERCQGSGWSHVSCPVSKCTASLPLSAD